MWKTISSSIFYYSLFSQVLMLIAKLKALELFYKDRGALLPSQKVMQANGLNKAWENNDFTIKGF